METKSKFTATHRILHWAMAFLMLILFLTGFLRMYWMGKQIIIEAISGERSGVPLRKEQLLSIAKSILDPMWQWHVYAAYGFFFIFLTRVIYMLIKGIKFPNPFTKSISVKERFQGSIYILFYLFSLISIITGIYLKWIAGQWDEPMATVHKWAIYWFPIFISLHLGGILIAELTNKKGIVSKMIGGA